jgi:methylenetetrahydrofolate dehydrogenase (NADP+)/methenyltetrahydrofolate cyclohydrolase
MGEWLEGRALAKEIRNKVREEASILEERTGMIPGLAAVLVGDNKASQIYVRTKERACQKLGLKSEVIQLPGDISSSALTKKIQEINQREDIDGILVQLPLPQGLDPHEMISAIDPGKDVDGFHPFSLGRLLWDQDGFKACTPYGIMELLKSRQIQIEGAGVVIIGRSLIVGKPLAAMMTNENGTVTVCHSRTKDLSSVAADADILIAAMGRAAFVTEAFVKEGAVVVDVGMNQLDDLEMVKLYYGEDEKRQQGFHERGYTLIGDVDPRVIDKVRFLTPVPGGVGPLTVAMLMRNTLDSFKRRRGGQA